MFIGKSHIYNSYAGDAQLLKRMPREEEGVPKSLPCIFVNVLLYLWAFCLAYFS